MPSIIVIGEIVGIYISPNERLYELTINYLAK